MADRNVRMYTGNEKEDKYIKEEYLLKLYPLISNYAIFSLNDYVKENGGKPLSVSRCKYIRNNILKNIYDEQMNKILENAKGENLGNETFSTVFYSVFGAVNDEIYGNDEKNKPSKLEEYINEHNLLPKDRKESFSEYAMKDESRHDYFRNLANLSNAIGENKVVVDIFKEYINSYKDEDGNKYKESINLADTSTMQNLLEEKKKQNSLFNTNDLTEYEENAFYKGYQSFKLSKDIVFVGDFLREEVDKKGNTETIQFLDNMTNVSVYKRKDDKIEPLETTFGDDYPEMSLYTYGDVYKLNKFRKYISEKKYDEIEEKLKIKYKGDYGEERYLPKKQIHVDEQGLKNGLAICEELERRGLPFEVECEEQGKLSAKVDLGAKQKLDVRIYDYKEPQYIGRVYANGAYTYFSNSKQDKGTLNRVGKYDAKEKDVLALLQYGLGERPDTALVNDKSGEVYSLGFKNDEFDHKYNQLKNNTTRNNNFRSTNNTNILYDMDGFYPVYMHTEYDKIKENDVIYEDSETAKQYVSDVIEQAKLNYETSILGMDFFDASNAENLQFPDVFPDEAASRLHNKYLEYLRNDNKLLCGVDETKEEFEERTERFLAKLASEDSDSTESESNEEKSDKKEEISVDEILTFEQKKDVVLNHISEMAEKNFGRVNGNTIQINFSNVSNYSGLSIGEISRAIKKCDDVDIDYMRTEEFNMNHVSEKMIKFDEKSSKSMLDNQELSPFMTHVKDTVVDSLAAQGFDLESLKIDDNGIICYEGKIINKTKYKNEDGPDTSQIKGYIGQVFEPDERGVICTKYNSTENRAIIPKYMAVVDRIDYDNEKSLEERTRCFGYKERLDRNIRYAIHDNFVRDNHANYDRETSINGLYRDMYADKSPLDYMTDFRSKGMDDELSNAIIKSKLKTIRYQTEYRDNSTLNTWYLLQKANIINDICSDAFAKTGEDISITNECVACDNVVTGNAYNQGILRYMREHAEIDSTGHLVPPRDENGEINEKDRMALFNLHEFRFLDNNPPDRQVMVAGNVMDCLHLDKNTNVAHMTLQGWTMDDAYVISKDYAEKHLVPCKEISYTEELEPRIIQKNICSDDGFLKTNISENGNEYVSFYGRNYSLEEVNKRFNETDNTKTKEEICSEYIKEQLIENKIGLRELMAGDKSCDLGGNKGVISLVVDRNMSKSKAKKLNLDYVTEVFKENPELDVIGAPFTAASRMNAGTVREMMENAKPLYLPDGKVIEGGMGTISMIITDKLVDEKSHIYDDDAYVSGKGRNASSQWAWQMQAKNSDKFMDLVFGNNEKNINKVRERLISLGYDWDSDYIPVKGYSPKHKEVIASNGANVIVAEKRDIIDIDYPDNLAYVNKESNIKATNYVAINRSLDKFRRDISKKGGFMRIPFELELKSGVKTEKATDGNGGYLLPILPAQMRSDESFDDGSKITHNYNSTYIKIARMALQYKASEIRSNEAERVLSARAAGEQNIESNIIPINVNSKNGVAKRSSADIRKRYFDDEIKEQDKLLSKVQSMYNEYANDIHDTYFKGKKNVFKTEIMNKSLPDSATAVWSPDPRCNIDECLMNTDMMEKLHLKEGDPVMVWRDPLLRPEGVAVMNVKKAFKENPIVGVAVNPAIDKRFDGDFDGDSVAIVSLSNEKYEKAIENKNNYIKYLNDRIEKQNKKKNPDMEKISNWENKIENTKRLLADDIDTLDKFNQARDEVIEKFSVKNTLADLAQTPDNPQTTDDVKFAVNTGLDIASVKGMLKEESKENYKASVNNKEYNLSELEELAKQDYINGDKDGSFNKVNTYVKTMLSLAKASDYNDYSSLENYYDCQNRMIVDHKAKGKTKAMVECSKYANHQITFKLDGDDKAYTGDEMLSYLKTDKDAVFRVNTEKGAIIDLGEEQPIRANINNPNLSKAQRRELIQRKEEMKDMMKQVMEATAIKTQGTGTAGAASQKGIKLTRNNAALNTLEITYGATQGILQAKHDAKQAKQLYTILKDTLPTLLNGKAIKEDPELGWIPDKERQGELLSKEEFIEQYYNLCNSSTGLNYEIRKERIENLANVMYQYDENGEEKFYSFYNAEKASILDRIVYNSQDSLAEYDKATESGKSLADTEKARQFLSPTRDIIEYDYSEVIKENHKSKSEQEISDEIERAKAKNVNQTQVQSVNIEQNAVKEETINETVNTNVSQADKLTAKYIELQQNHYDKYENKFNEIIEQDKKVKICRYDNKNNKLIPVDIKELKEMTTTEKNALSELLDRENVLMFVKDKGNETVFERFKPIKDAYNDKTNFEPNGRFYINENDSVVSEKEFRSNAESKVIENLKKQESNQYAVQQIFYREKINQYIPKYENCNDAITMVSGYVLKADKISGNNQTIKYSDLSVQKQQGLRQELSGVVSRDDKRILVIGPTPEQLYGNVPDTNTKSKYFNLNRQIRDHVNKLYEDGYREFVTIATPGYNKFVNAAVSNLQEQHPNEITNVVLIESADNYKNYPPADANKRLFSQDSVKNMLDKANRVIEVDKYKGMDEVVKQCSNVSIVYPEKDNWMKNKKDDTLAHFIKVVRDAKKNLKMPDIDMTNTIAYRKCVEEENKNALAENKVLVDNLNANNNMQNQYV